MIHGKFVHSTDNIPKLNHRPLSGLTKTLGKHVMNHAATFPNTANGSTGAMTGCFEIAGTVCDLERSRLHADGIVHRLEPKQVGVLALLIRRQASVVTRDEFLDSVWDEDASDEALNQAISRLRKLLGDGAAIVTEPRVGYRLSRPATPVAGAPSVPMFQKLGPATSRVRDSISPSHLAAFGFGFAVAAFIALSWYALAGPRNIEQEFILSSDGETVTLGPGATGIIETD
jgi:DNA-binding winged helix-turn-helix (wHTH) protein